MRVAVIGSGGREHAVAWALERYHPKDDVFVLPGNGGTRNSAPIDPGDGKAIERFCKERRVELVVVGPEAPLAAGLVDDLRAAGVAAFGPTRQAAQLEGSKLFAKRFMKRHGIATADSWAFDGGGDARRVVDDLGGKLVLKYDGLAAGKGVWVCRSVDEATLALDELHARHGAAAPFLVEQLLDGDELSIIGFTDGESIRLLPPAQDHKALRDGDRGPNTGGMGAFSPVPQVGEALMRQIHDAVIAPTLAGLRAERFDYRGLLYFGLMLTDAGPRLLEYNVRLGDPEAEVLLPHLKTDLAKVAQACLSRRLADLTLEIDPGYAVGVVLAAPGYPARPETGQPIHGLDAASPAALVFHAGTRRDGGRLVTSGGRVLTVVARDLDLEAAIEKAYRAVDTIGFEGMQLRRDIGRRTWRLASSA
jgi:phosphoribosylamine--glycine ligase